jgi:aryl-alcohol dehydrogenase-like predicted oxidoreductase
MSFRRLGNSGLAVSVVGLGTNNFGMKLDLDGCREVLDAALETGITLIDTADSYGASEARLGELLQGRRDDVVLATKFGSDAAVRGNGNGADWGARGSRRYIRKAVEASLRRLHTDWIDLYQMHRPDPDWTARTRGYQRFISAQNHYNLLERGIEADLVPALRSYGVGLLPYFPLASGLLTGKYRRGEDAPAGSRIAAWGRQSLLTAETFDALEALESFAAQRQLSLLDVAVGGLAAQPTVASVIAGATSAAQVRANVEAGRWSPSPEELAELDLITQPDPAAS